ncbi:MAG: hypothetical protein ACLFPX_03425 [Candidatus Omnitrophota bacterium]
MVHFFFSPHGRWEEEGGPVISLLATVIWLFFICAVGWVICRLLDPERALSWPLYCGSAFGLGAGAVAFAMFFCDIMTGRLYAFGVTVFLALVCLASWFFFLRRGNATQAMRVFPRVGRFRPAEIAILIVIMFYVVHVVVMTITQPIMGWDAVSYIAFNGKVLFHERTLSYLSNMPHADYPLLIPLLQSWLAMQIGVWHEYLLKAVMPAYFISFGFIVFGFLRFFVSRFFALFGVLFLFSAPGLRDHAAGNYMDLPLMYYFSGAVLLAVLSLSGKGKKYALLSALLLTGAVWTKLEGGRYALLMIPLLLIAYFFKRRRTRQSFLAQSAVYSVPLFFFFGWQGYIFFRGIEVRTDTRFFWPADLFIRLHKLVPHAVNVMGEIHLWGLAWWMLLLALLAGWRKLSFPANMLLIGIGVFHASLFGGLIFTSSFKYLFPVDVVLPRLMLHGYPLIPVSAVILLARVCSESRSV